MRAAIYARMSTDKQSADSPADQIARCRDFARVRGWRVVEELVLQDAGISGASRHNRPRLLELISRLDEWDVLLCFDFSRLARDAEDLGWIRNRLRVQKRTAFAAADGLELFNVGAKVLGVMNEEFLVKLRADTHRGLRGRVERGFSGGGTPYGYQSEAVHRGRTGGRGEAIPDGYRLKINEPAAATVRRIFEDYTNGVGLRAIASALNAEGIPSPRGRGWAPAALHALLRNPIYVGEHIWNRSEWIKDHETGRRRRHERPESEWLRRFDESLRIIPDELWQRAVAARAARGGMIERRSDGTIARTRPHPANRSPSKHLLSGLLECAECGGSVYVLDSGGRYGCSWRRDRGPSVCGNRVTVPHGELESGLLRAFRDEILVPENVAYTVERALEIIRTSAAPDREIAKRRAAELSDQIARLVRLAESAGDVDEIGGRIAVLRREREGLARALEAPSDVLDGERLREKLRGELERVNEWLGAPGGGGRDVLRALLGGQRMRFGPDEKLAVRVEGAFELRLDLREGRRASAFGQVVAGTGFEPVTFGL